jgi:hypothetical protein
MSHVDSYLGAQVKDNRLTWIRLLLVVSCVSLLDPQTIVLAASPDAQEATANAQDMYWIGGGGKWTEAKHWSRDSGGKAAANGPGKSDNVIFDDKSGSGRILLDEDITIANLLVKKNINELVFSQTGGVLNVVRDAVFSAGALAKGNSFNIVVGRNFDTAALILKLNKGKYLGVSLTGTGYWRYSLKPEHKPKVSTLKAAFPGQTTTLRPVEIAPQGIDIDALKCVLGDKTSRLTMDLSEVTQKKRIMVTLELHQNGKEPLDIESDGCKVSISSIEHEGTSRRGPLLLQHKLDLSDIKVYDLTGGYKSPRGKGVIWQMTGPLIMPKTHMALDKTLTLNMKEFELQVSSISVSSNGGTAEIVMGTGKLAAGVIRLGNRDYPGHIQLNTGTLICKTLNIAKGSSISGQKGSSLEVTDSITVEEGATFDLANVTLIGKAKRLTE